MDTSRNCATWPMVRDSSAYCPKPMTSKALRPSKLLQKLFGSKLRTKRGARQLRRPTGINASSYALGGATAFVVRFSPRAVPLVPMSRTPNGQGGQLCFLHGSSQAETRRKSFYFEHPHLRDLDWGWAFQGVSGVGHSRETLGLGIPGVSGLGTPGIFGVGHSRGWAVQGVSAVGHSRKSLGVDRARRRVEFKI